MEKNERVGQGGKEKVVSEGGQAKMFPKCSRRTHCSRRRACVVLRIEMCGVTS